MIPIHNIYYMLSYAYQVLREKGYKDMATEQFDNTADLCAAILTKGVAMQLKRGLYRAYVAQTEPLSTLRGKIDMTESIKTQTILKRQLVCTYDEFTVNSYMNQVIKSTMELLLISDIAKARKKELRKILVYFADVESIDIHTINWQFRYNRNNQTYRMLHAICYLVIKGLLQSEADGSTRMMDVFDEQRMSRLYEKFILEYYRREIPKISTNASQIPWQLDDRFDDMLPVMQSDIMLSYGHKILIIDAKYYSRNTQSQYDKHTLHSNNLYQIFTYVKNKAAAYPDDSKTVAGMLLYAKTDDITQPRQTYQMSGNQISVRTLDLNCAFDELAEQLNAIAIEYFGVNPKEDVDMTNQEKLRFVQPLRQAKIKNMTIYYEVIYEMLEKIGGLKTNYSAYLKTAPINCDEELKRLNEADFDLSCALLTMVLREDHFSNGMFESRCESGVVDQILDRMIVTLS